MAMQCAERRGHTFNQYGYSVNLHFRPRHECDADGHCASDGKASSGYHNEVLHLRIPLSLDHDTLRFLRVIFTGRCHDRDVLRRGQLLFECARAVHDGLEFPRH